MDSFCNSPPSSRIIIVRWEFGYNHDYKVVGIVSSELRCCITS